MYENAGTWGGGARARLATGVFVITAAKIARTNVPTNTANAMSVDLIEHGGRPYAS
jgi:hypothetical protein